MRLDAPDAPGRSGSTVSDSIRGSAAHRDDIQGLRALAVGIVLLAHAALGPFAGGFVGVDVFFVISGFLITQLLLRETARTGGISLRGFYARRARRILPASTLVLVATVGASALWLGPMRIHGVLRDAAWSAFFAANIRFAHEGTDYFAVGLPPSPLQHFWSLAVEEQFYLVWPVLLLAVVAVARRRRGEGIVPVRSLVVVVGVAGAASLAWSIHATEADPNSAYFSTLTRGWELAAGALAALGLLAAERSNRTTAPPRALLEAVAATGLVAILVACVRFDEHTPFPGSAALVPVLGTVAVLVAGGFGGGRTVVARLLAVRPARAVGDWSYSLYLWHWPLLVIPAGYAGRDLPTVDRVLLIGLAVLLSWASYRWVETPLRRPRRWTAGARAIVLYPATVALVLTTCVSANAYVSSSLFASHAPAVALGPHWRSTYGTDDRAEALVTASIRAARHHHPVPGRLRPSLADVLDSVPDLGACEYQDDSVRRLCPRGDVDADRTLVVLGNSHARHWIPAFETIAREAGYRAYYLAKVQCVGALVVPDRAASGKPFTACGEFHDWALDQIARLHPDLVVLSTSPGDHGVWDADGRRHTDPAEVRDLLRTGYVDMLRALQERADRTVLLEDIPGVARDPAACLGHRPDDLGSCLMPMDRNYPSRVQDQADAAASVGVASIPTRQWFCRRGVCPSVVGDMIVYRDGGHMTNDYSASLAEPLRAVLGLPAATG